MSSILQADEPVFGSWYITKKLDQGSTGQLYQIHKKDAMGHDCYSALKVIRIPSNGYGEVKALLSSGLAEEDLEDYYQSVIDNASNEFTILSRLKGNTNIVSYEDHEIIRHKDSSGWDIFIRMEQITPLLDYSLEHEITEDLVLKMGMDICHGLALCARHKIIHRDIKPANIFVSDNGDFKIGDFGIARIFEQTQTYLSRKGTFTYMAPEVFRGDKYTENVDVYSLGLVMYQYLNYGRGPFVPAYPKTMVYADNEKAMAKRMSGFEIPAPANGSPRLKEIVLKACAYESSQRYETAQEMLDDLEELCEEGRQTVRREKKISALPRYKRSLYRFWFRKKRALIAAAAVMICCAAFCSVMFFRGVTGINGPDNDTVLLTGDTVSPEYTIEPFWFHDSGIAFESSDPGIFTVDADGQITAQGPGDAVLKMNCRNFTGYAQIHVDPKVKDIENVSDLELYTGDSRTLKPQLKPEKYADEKISFSSSKSTVAAISDKGKITAQKAGSTMITITAGGASKTLQVTVTDKPVPEEDESADAGSSGSLSSYSAAPSVPSAGYSSGAGTGSGSNSSASSGTKTKSKPAGSKPKKDTFGDEEYF